MKILTWNVERPTKNAPKIKVIEDQLKQLDADILILTETNEFINPGEHYHAYHTVTPTSTERSIYKSGERRVSIFTKYEMIKPIDTFNPETALCLLLKTSSGDLAVYGTVIGVLGNKGDQFKNDLDLQIEDFKRIALLHPVCIAGDINISFSDNYYFTKEGRDKLTNVFTELGLTNLTAFLPNDIDHIIITENFIGRKRNISTWNTDKAKNLSDHMGVMMEI